ncbi:related to transcriptional repressor [Cephalotrichum gorgonifer]|uniref:C2H2 type master regulator of conidiophore development brlA n=1 Tax=Cephalotrichum gorgonifer TaxID=2041049 RepID=A0AAE8MSV5_9PEZI|nr:related to transcriptional repressor [Cephalotrichum gorgonifer]
MHARDSSGRRISLLNDNPPTHATHYDTTSHRTRQSFSQQQNSSRGSSSSPYTPPELHLAESYDSSSPRSDPISPLTPTVPYDYPRTYVYAGAQPGYDDYHVGRKHGSFSDSTRSGSYEDEVAPAAPAPPPAERLTKRYPCRFRDSHGCDKSFTTSGHASRHSRIHTAEKAVQCTYAGCQKKFTRADNMKQHYETHYKEKSRSSGSQRAGKSSSSTRKPPSISTRHRARDQQGYEYDVYGQLTPGLATPLASPATGAWDLRGLNGPLMTPHGGSMAPRNGLDALAMAAAHQEDA